MELRQRAQAFDLVGVPMKPGEGLVDFDHPALGIADRHGVVHAGQRGLQLGLAGLHGRFGPLSFGDDVEGRDEGAGRRAEDRHRVPVAQRLDEAFETLGRSAARDAAVDLEQLGVGRPDARDQLGDAPTDDVAQAALPLEGGVDLEVLEIDGLIAVEHHPAMGDAVERVVQQRTDSLGAGEGRRQRAGTELHPETRVEGF